MNLAVLNSVSSYPCCKESKMLFMWSGVGWHLWGTNFVLSFMIVHTSRK